MMIVPVPIDSSASLSITFTCWYFREEHSTFCKGKVKPIQYHDLIMMRYSKFILKNFTGMTTSRLEIYYTMEGYITVLTALCPIFTLHNFTDY